MPRYGRGDLDMALQAPVSHVLTRPSTSSTNSLLPNTAYASARLSYDDQSALYLGLLEPPCATPDVNCPRGVTTDANFISSAEPLHELNEFELLSGSTTGSGMDLPSQNQQKSCSGKPRIKKEQRFACLYCERAFSQSHDFKRHFKDSHESEDLYVCDGDNCSLQYRLADKFRAHHQKSHRCGKVGEKCQHAEKCRRPNSDQKARRGCGACLHYSETLEDWLNHVANHYNNGFKKKDWNDDRIFSSLLSQPGLVEAWARLTSKPFPQAAWIHKDRDRLQTCMERNSMTPVNLVQDIYTTCYGYTTGDTTLPPSQMQPAQEGLPFDHSTLNMGNMGISAFSPPKYNFPSPLTDQSISMTLPQTRQSTDAFDLRQIAEDDVAFTEPFGHYPGFSNIKYVTRDPGHSYTGIAHEPYRVEPIAERQYVYHNHRSHTPVQNQL